jgi:hypothetical protein
MALYPTNTGFDDLIIDGALDEQQLTRWFEEATIHPAEGGSYRTKRFESGLLIIFREVEKRVVGIDMHMGGRSTWSAKPLIQVGEEEPLSLTLMMTNRSESSLFIATLVHAATREHFREEEVVDLQVCAFVQALDIYDSRTSYERAIDEELWIADKKILPYNYIMSREETVGEDERAVFEQGQTLVLIAAPVIAVETRSHGWRQSASVVATVGTEMGHLDLIFSSNQVPQPLTKGDYIVTQCAISADVLF